MTFPTAPTFPVRFGRPISSTFPSAPTFPPVGPSNPGQPQITLVDFAGQTGLSYVTGGEGLYFFVYGDPSNERYLFWVNTGAETEPSVVGPIGGNVEIDVSEQGAAAQPSDLSAAAVAAVELSEPSVWTAAQSGDFGNTGVILTTAQSRNFTAAVDGNTGAAITTTQEGQAPS